MIQKLIHNFCHGFIILFQVFDIDGNGVIDAMELKMTMRNLGENLSDADVKAMIRTADKNGDGKIDYEGIIKEISFTN